MKDWKPLGSHRIASEGDAVYLEVHGPMDLAEIRQLYGMAEDVLAQHHWVALIVDVRNAGLPSLQARRFIADWEQRHPASEGVAIFVGASQLLLTMGRLIFHAVKMLTPRRSSGPFWAATEAEALTLMSAHRPKGSSPDSGR